MRPLLVVPGACLGAVGVLWVLQGSNVLTGFAMSGSPFWLGTGVALWIVGTILVVAGVARRAPAPSTPAA